MEKDLYKLLNNPNSTDAQYTFPVPPFLGKKHSPYFMVSLGLGCPRPLLECTCTQQRAYFCDFFYIFYAETNILNSLVSSPILYLNNNNDQYSSFFSHSFFFQLKSKSFLISSISFSEYICKMFS